MNKASIRKNIFVNISVNKNYTLVFFELSVFFLFLIIVVLTSVNIHVYLTHKNPKTLGVNTQVQSSNVWVEFMKENPNYIPGWIELGRIDKALKIDPNYFISQNKNP